MAFHAPLVDAWQQLVNIRRPVSGIFCAGAFFVSASLLQNSGYLLTDVRKFPIIHSNITYLKYHT